MSDATSSAAITEKSQLISYFESGNKPKDQWRIGTEHEKFAFCDESFKSLTYDGTKSIKAILEGLAGRFGWTPVYEAGNIIALTDNGASVTLEPGGQLELSGAPLETLHDTCREVHSHLHQVKEITEPLGIHMLGMGFNPKWGKEGVNWMPKGRYRIMRDYMPKRGKLGVDMMTLSCTVQVNLDFSSEADMIHKFRTSLALQPLATALFANSPFREGKPNGYLSYRSHLWTDTDPDRCGMLSFVFEDGMGFERYVDYMLDVPMYFVYRDGKYIDVSGESFRDFMQGKLKALPGELPTIKDWDDHITTAFPEVRMKKFLEMRGADGGPWKSLCALPAFWVGLLYDQTALDAAWDLVKDWSDEERQLLRSEVPEKGLSATIRGVRLQEIAREIVGIARSGLENRGRIDGQGQDETHFLNTLSEIAESGITPAEEKLKAFYTRWGEKVDPAFVEYAY
ncbi:glutamate--cysteine ligase [Kiloniella laminariae]|uniref:Glutamate--cysteine ligase n=1 Tax=Kiloniella laminariae TaxID=454162 RepID=A0ABT4LKY8_9PROT|nr:glutamate--cysteine ligase [Kiloniella laminariae]MCZ4281773.1 glutamate--cysteine ligase [Kiloniella laminariae]